MTTDNETDERTAFIVHRTLNDNAKRKQNVIVTGLPETNSASEDRIEFLRLCEENLNIKPLVAESDCVRIGKNKPRRLLVRLRSEDTAVAVLRDSPSLRLSHSAYVAQHVYINPDLSPAAAKLAFDARKLRRERKYRRQQLESTAAATVSDAQTTARTVTSNDVTGTVTDTRTTDTVAADRPVADLAVVVDRTDNNDDTTTSDREQSQQAQPTTSTFR